MIVTLNEPGGGNRSGRGSLPMSVQILEHEGRPVFVLMPIEEYERLLAALEDAHCWPAGIPFGCCVAIVARPCRSSRTPAE